MGFSLRCGRGVGRGEFAAAWWIGEGLKREVVGCDGRDAEELPGSHREVIWCLWNAYLMLIVLSVLLSGIKVLKNYSRCSAHKQRN